MTPSSPTASTAISNITGVVLAGGRGERFGGVDKGLIELAGLTLITRVLARLRPQVDQLLIVANRNQDAYAALGAPVIGDQLQNFQGPLAGIAAALAVVTTSHAMIVPTDAVCLPLDLIARMRSAQQQSTHPLYVRAADGPMPVCCLLAAQEREDIECALASNQRGVLQWLRSRAAVEVDFSNWPQTYWSVNTPEELAPLEMQLREKE